MTQIKFKSNALKKDIKDWMVRNHVVEVLSEEEVRREDWDCDWHSWRVKTSYGRELVVKTSHGKPYFA